MRVLSTLLLLGCSLLGVSSQYVTDAGSSFGAGWLFNGVQNPTFNFTAGNTYTFDISASSPGHPFNFSKDTTSGSPAVTNLDANFYTVSTNTNCSSSGNGYVGSGCIVSLTIKPNAPSTTIFYKCTLHYPMTGSITVTAAATGNTTVTPTTATPTTGGATTATPTTATPTTATPTTATPTTPAPITGTIVGNSFHITGASGTTAYIFTDKGVQYLNPTLNVTAGTPVTISIDFTNYIHPFGFSNNNSPNTVSLTQAFFPDSLNTYTVNNATVCDFRASSAVHTVIANVTGTPCVLTIPTQASDAGKTLYYRCGYHFAMIGTINVAASGTSSSSSSTGSSTSSSSSTGGNTPGTASTVTGAGLALVVALMAAIMA